MLTNSVTMFCDFTANRKLIYDVVPFLKNKNFTFIYKKMATLLTLMIFRERFRLFA